MKNIHRNKTKFQSFLETFIFVIRILFDEVPIEDRKPYIFISPNAAEVEKLKRAHHAFELKKRGGAR